jgi:hypothetical protein
MDVMPAKSPTPGPWHAAQLVTPAWFMAEFENRAPSTTGVEAMLDPGATWHTSQDCEVGIWLIGIPVIEKFRRGMANRAAFAPWHWVQLLVVLGAYR